MRKPPKARAINGIISACIVVFFFVHAAMGGASTLFGLPRTLSFVAWLGVAAICAHIITSIITSYQQLNDEEHPPSSRKKRHLALKWATGGLLAVVAIVHVVTSQVLGAGSAFATGTGVALMTLLVVVLAVHICVGAKSLLTDLRLDKRYLLPLRIAVCVIAAVLVVMSILAGFAS